MIFYFCVDTKKVYFILLGEPLTVCETISLSCEIIKVIIQGIFFISENVVSVLEQKSCT